MKKILKRITPLLLLYRFYFKKKNQLYNWYTIPNYKTKRKIILKQSEKYNCKGVFIETGTFMGDTVEYVKDNFLRVFSIELSNELATKAQQRFQREEKISIIQGDSTQQLSKILQSINEPCVFWLDGHYSSEFWAGDTFIVTAKGEKETPILEELKQIAHHSHKNDVILVDDARLFIGKGDYPDISVLREFSSKYFPGHSLSVKNDIIRILPKQVIVI
jgi:hypothetical protein